MKINPEKIEAFLTELTELTKKHGIVIHGCGCCGSPSLFDIEDYKKHDAPTILEPYTAWRYRYLQAVGEAEIEYCPTERQSHRASV